MRRSSVENPEVEPAFHSVLDFGLRDIGVESQPRKLAAHLARRSAPLLALAVVFAIVPCLFLRRVGAGPWAIAAFAAAWAAVVLVFALRTVVRAPVTVVKVRADGPNQASWLAITPFALATAATALAGGTLVFPVAAVLLLMVVLVWRGRTRVPELVARVRGRLEEGERVLGDGLGLARGPARGVAAVRLIVATDRRLLLAAPLESLLVVDAPYDRITRFGIGFRQRGRAGSLTLAVGEQRLEIAQIAPANLLSIAQALVGRGVETDDGRLIAQAAAAWEEALTRGRERAPLLDRAAMRTRAFDRGAWLVLGLGALAFYLNPFGIGLGESRDAIPALLAVPVLGLVCGSVSGTRASIAYLAPLNLLAVPAFFFYDAGDVIGIMVALSALATLGLWAGAGLLGSRAAETEAGRAARGSLRDAVSGLGLVRISALLLALTAALVGASTATGIELVNVRLAVQQATAQHLPVDGRSNLAGGAASLRYTPGPGLVELVTDERPLAGPFDGARWELRSSFTKGYNTITLGHYVVRPSLDNPAAIAAFVAAKDRAHSRLAAARVSHTTRVVDGRTGYVWEHGGPSGYWYYAAWFPQPEHSVRVECIARREASRFKRLCAEAMGSLEFR
jgi:hypothetical protein